MGSGSTRTTTLRQDITDEEYDSRSESGSMLVEHGSYSDASVVSNDSSDTEGWQSPTTVSFDSYTLQVGSHMAYGAERSELLALGAELEHCEIDEPLLSAKLTGHPVSSRAQNSVMDVHRNRVPSSHDLCELRRQNICEVIADVDRLFADHGHQHHHQAEAVACTHKGSISMSEGQQDADELLYDVEKQEDANGLPSKDNRRRTSTWLTASRTAYFIMMVTALAWYSLFLRC